MLFLLGFCTSASSSSSSLRFVPPSASSSPVVSISVPKICIINTLYVTAFYSFLKTYFLIAPSDNTNKNLKLSVFLHYFSFRECRPIRMTSLMANFWTISHEGTFSDNRSNNAERKMEEIFILMSSILPPFFDDSMSDKSDE